jgi:hypothetical protein
MSMILDQIKALQKKQATIDMYSQADSLLQSSLKNPAEHEGVAEEVLAVLGEFIASRKHHLESGAPEVAQAPAVEPFTPEEMTAIRALLQRLSQRATSDAPAPATPQPRVTDRNDKLRFALENKSLENKRVSVDTEHGRVLGVVVGLDAPNVIVKTDTGYTVPVDVRHIKVSA